MATTILLADDDERVRTLLRKRLTSGGYDVVEAANGDEALRIYRETPRDVVITDIVMPGKGGRELITELQQEFPNVRIVAISGAIDRDVSHLLGDAARLGALRTLAKPFTSEQLFNAVQAVLEGDVAAMRPAGEAQSRLPERAAPWLRWAGIAAVVAVLIAVAVVMGWIGF